MTWHPAPKIVPPVCLAAGVMAAVLATAATSGHAPQTAEALRKYAELPSGEVRRLKATWQRLSATPDDRAAIRSIQEAVRQDPQLDEQLTLFYAWWVATNPEQRTELHGTPDEEWADRVRQLMADSREPEGLEITFQGPGRPGTGNRSFETQVSDEQLEAFFQSALPDNQLSAEEQALLSGVGEEDRFLARALILVERLTPESFRRDSPPESAALDQVFNAIITHLFPNMRNRREFLRNREEPVKAAITFATLRSIVDHFGPSFMKRTAHSTPELVDTFEQLDPAEQQRLMTGDPATAVSVLRARRARESGDEANAVVAARLVRFRERVRGISDRLNRPPRSRDRNGNGPPDRPRPGRREPRPPQP